MEYIFYQNMRTPFFSFRYLKHTDKLIELMQIIPDTIPYAFGLFGGKPQNFACYQVKLLWLKIPEWFGSIKVCRIIYYWLTWLSNSQQLDNIFINMSYISYSWNKNWIMSCCTQEGRKNKLNFSKIFLQNVKMRLILNVTSIL